MKASYRVDGVDPYQWLLLRRGDHDISIAFSPPWECTGCTTHREKWPKRIQENRQFLGLSYACIIASLSHSLKLKATNTGFVVICYTSLISF